MAKKKSAPARKRPAGKKAAKGRKRGSTRRASMQGAFMEIAKGVLGAVIASKVLPKIPVENPKLKYALGAGVGTLIAVKGGKELASVGIGMGIASGSLLANEFMPNLLGPSSTTPIGRVSSETQKRMVETAAKIRAGIAGMRDRTIVGTGGGMEPAVQGTRDRTIVGSGDYSDPIY